MDASLQTGVIISSVVYASLGLVLMLVFIGIAEMLFHINLKKEILQEHNNASAIVLAGLFIGIAIIVAAAIL